MYDGTLVFEAQNAEKREVTLHVNGSSASILVLPEPRADDKHMDQLIDENKDQYEKERKPDESSSTPQERAEQREISPEPDNEEQELKQQATRLEEEIRQLRVELR